MTKNPYPIKGCKKYDKFDREEKFGHSLDPKSELKTKISILKDYGAKCTGLVQVAGSQKDSFDVLQSNDLSFASTETKFKNPITQTQNNIVIFGFFHKKMILSFWLFLK